MFEHLFFFSAFSGHFQPNFYSKSICWSFCPIKCNYDLSDLLTGWGGTLSQNNAVILLFGLVCKRTQQDHSRLLIIHTNGSRGKSLPVVFKPGFREAWRSWRGIQLVPWKMWNTQFHCITAANKNYFDHWFQCSLLSSKLQLVPCTVCVESCLCEITYWA